MGVTRFMVVNTIRNPGIFRFQPDAMCVKGHTDASNFWLAVFLIPVVCNLMISEFLLSATRESAFVHAIASAGVAFAVTRACAEGSATICGCDTRHKGPPGEGWKWGGCSEDVDFGSMVSREFADARENRPDARSAMNRHNNEAGRMVGFLKALPSEFYLVFVY